MATYLVYLPPAQAFDGVKAIEKARLVHDGFRPFALVFGPFWFLAKRLWFSALAVLLALILIRFGLVWLSLPLLLLPPIQMVFNLLIGLEAATLERRRLRRKGWREVDVVVARNAKEAEQKAIERLVEREHAPAQPNRTASGALPQPPIRPSTPPHAPALLGTQPVVGLFPEAGR
jgi:hypothetical protein